MSITVRNITIGEGIPKIAVPIISREKHVILSDAERIGNSDADICEWRVDFFVGMQDVNETVSLAKEIRTALGDKLLLLTCRTSAEGGEAEISTSDYERLLFAAVESNCADLLDAELAASESFLEELIGTAHSAGMGIVLSYHNFRETPTEAYLIEKYSAMDLAGGDILKIAVMPNSMEDVDRMIKVSRKASEKFAEPIVAIVMGQMGQCTRIACEPVGSCITFGTIGGESAPGQISAERLSQMMRKIHENSDAFSCSDDSEKLMEMIRKFCF